MVSPVTKDRGCINMTALQPRRQIQAACLPDTTTDTPLMIDEQKKIAVGN